LDKLPLPEALFAEAPGTGQEGKPEEDAVAALLDWWRGKSPDPSRQADLLQCLEHFLRRPLPPAVKEGLLLQIAQLQWCQGNFPQAARIYQELLKANTRSESSAFYQDRLALSQLQGRRPETALEIYRGLSQEGDNFWQLVSRTRLADVELGRIQTEPPQ
jgi:tetratricopeptide (TPR) repeat protein